MKDEILRLYFTNLVPAYAIAKRMGLSKDEVLRIIRTSYSERR